MGDFVFFLSSLKNMTCSYLELEKDLQGTGEFVSSAWDNLAEFNKCSTDCLLNLRPTCGCTYLGCTNVQSHYGLFSSFSSLLCAGVHSILFQARSVSQLLPT